MQKGILQIVMMERWTSFFKIVTALVFSEKSVCVSPKSRLRNRYHVDLNLLGQLQYTVVREPYKSERVSLPPYFISTVPGLMPNLSDQCQLSDLSSALLLFTTVCFKNFLSLFLTPLPLPHAGR